MESHNFNVTYNNTEFLKFNLIKYLEQCTNHDLCKIKRELYTLLSYSRMFTRKHEYMFEQLQLFIDNFPEHDDFNKPSRNICLNMLSHLPSHIAITSILMDKFADKESHQPHITYQSMCGIQTHNENYVRKNYEQFTHKN